VQEIRTIRNLDPNHVLRKGGGGGRSIGVAGPVKGKWGTIQIQKKTEVKEKEGMEKVLSSGVRGPKAKRSKPSKKASLALRSGGAVVIGARTKARLSCKVREGQRNDSWDHQRP